MKSTIYIDNQATTPTDPEVIKAMNPYFYEKFANPASSNFMGVEIDEVVEDARLLIAKAINAEKNEIIFTGCATESINLALKGYFDNLREGHIITLTSEHSAVLNTCKYLEAKGIKVTYLDVEGNGLLNLKKLEDAINNQRTLVAIMHVNNEIGVIQDIEAIGKICRKKNAVLFVDAAQSFGKLPIDVVKSNVSMLSISGHKIYAPKGVGVVYINKKEKNQIVPLLHGGGQEGELRSGTLNVPFIVALAKATEIAIADMQEEQKRILQLRTLLLKNIQAEVSDVVINGDMEHRIAGNLNLSFKGVSGDVLMNRLDDIAISRGSACNSSKNQGSHVLKAIGLPEALADSAIRISIGRFNTEKEIIYVSERIISIVNEIRKISNLN